MQSAATAPTLTIGYTVSGNYSGADIVVCLVEDEKITTPTAGENAGVNLYENNISRKFIVTPISSATGTISLTPPANCVRAKSHIVAYVQNHTSMYIRGGTTGIDLGTFLTGIPTIPNNTEITIYPNPANESIYISYMNTDNKGNIVMSLTDLSGRLVYSENIATTSIFEKKMDVSSLAKGVYILNLKTEAAAINKKVMVE